MRFLWRFFSSIDVTQLLLMLALALIGLGTLAWFNERKRRGVSADEPSFTYTLGPYTPAVVDNFVLKDPQRNRDIPLKIYYPRADGPFPVIFFSHGTGGSKDAFSHLSRFWASHGYVAIHPSHPGSDKETAQAEGVLALMETNKNPQQWVDRAQDIVFLLDSLAQLEHRVPQLRGRLDPERVGMAGHSFGAFTTLLLGGAKARTPRGRTVATPDARIRACLAISPQGMGKFGLYEHSWDQIKLPVLTVSGTRERGASWRQEPFEHMPPGDKFHLVIEGATHSSYNDYKAKRARGIDGRAVMYRTHLTLHRASLAFWDRYLKGENGTELQTFIQKTTQITITVK
ncbi:alpha/beta hydrolase family protein [Anthocerotibacter panamensis]|uniref:alpha/beta hydrolase family protein n=1 Tax=Anthocerotibacter panamensis TaxID=2857077 RepID=UPI001C406553|nr:alpha/beta fold hydrolase [Anthocerotibacter panamensis]